MAEAARCPGEPGRRPHHNLPRIAIDPIARGGREIRYSWWPLEPAWKEAGDHRVTRLELGHALAHRLDHAGAVGHRDACVRCWHPSAHDTIVVVVKRARVNPDPDLAGTGHSGTWHLGQLKLVEATG